jgi:hypothetical protein
MPHSGANRLNPAKEIVADTKSIGKSVFGRVN